MLGMPLDKRCMQDMGHVASHTSFFSGAGYIWLLASNGSMPVGATALVALIWPNITNGDVHLEHFAVCLSVQHVGVRS